MSIEGTIFDIKQLAVFDGPGIRTTVFFKGCPLKCMWCHNPEGLSFKPQIMKSSSGCLRCGRCREVCSHPDQCTLCGACVRICPKHLIKICGTVVTSDWLAQHLLRDEGYLERVQGGITFSGGEPLAQPEFLLDCLQRLAGFHTCIETSGYARPDMFRRAVELLDYIIMDVKLVDESRHRYYTGAGNSRILENLEYLKQSSKPFRIRIPVIPGVNDDQENMEATARLLEGARMLDFVELLPYHTTAGAKYSMVGAEYRPEFDESRKPDCQVSQFEQRGIQCRII